MTLGFLFYLPIPGRLSSLNFLFPRRFFISVPPLHILQIMFIKNLYGKKKKKKKRNLYGETALVVQWLRLHAPKAGGLGSIPGRETRIPHAAWHSLKKKKRKLHCASPPLSVKGALAITGPNVKPPWPH